MQNLIQEGAVVTLTAPYNVTAGAGALVSGIFGVATTTITSGSTGEFATEGVFDLARAGSQTFVQGGPVFWDDANKNCTTTASGNQPIGHCVVAGVTADTTLRVRLSGRTRFFQSSEQTGTGSAQNIAHGLGRTPTLVIVYPTDTAPATTGAYTLTEGTHTSTNVVVTVTSGKKYRVVAFVL